LPARHREEAMPHDGYEHRKDLRGTPEFDAAKKEQTGRCRRTFNACAHP
jgi:hypothetical protein